MIATTQDLAALVTEIGGDKVTVEALARGYQDPHFVEAKPSFVAQAPLGRPARRRRPRPRDRRGCRPLITQSRNAKLQPGGAGYFDASQTVRILDMPTGADHAGDG